MVKSFGFRDTTLAINNVSFNVNKGTRFGILGADGAGKTTLLRILATTLRPTEGSVRIGGLDPGKEVAKVRELVGYSPANLDVRSWTDASRYLSFWAKVAGLSSTERKSRIAAVTDLLELGDELEEDLKLAGVELQRRLILAQALLPDPEVLLLDEPMTGLGVSAKMFIAEKLQSLRKEGKTVLLSSNRLTDVRITCDSIAVMSDGRMTRVFETGDLLRRIGEGKDARIFIDCDPLPSRALEALRGVEGVVDVKSAETATVVYIIPGRVDMDSLQSALSSENVDVRGIKRAEIKLGDVFSTLYT